MLCVTSEGRRRSSAAGFAIFLLMVAGERGVRDLWRSLLLGQCCAADSDTAPTSRPVQSASGDASVILLAWREVGDTGL